MIAALLSGFTGIAKLFDLPVMVLSCLLWLAGLLTLVCWLLYKEIPWPGYLLTAVPIFENDFRIRKERDLKAVRL